MPAPDEPYYCSQQIPIPPELPDILKTFTKAAIRTQPTDVLAWSAAYFKALSMGEIAPVKDRVEMPIATQKTDTGLTPGLLKILNKQLGPKKVVDLSMIDTKWKELNLTREKFDDLVHVGGFNGETEWLKFLSLAASSLAENITGSMKLICEILTADPEGGAARVPFSLWKNLYFYLAEVDGAIPQSQMDEAIAHLQEDVDKQDGYVQPRNFLSGLCPSLS